MEDLEAVKAMVKEAIEAVMKLRGKAGELGFAGANLSFVVKYRKGGDEEKPLDEVVDIMDSLVRHLIQHAKRQSIPFEGVVVLSDWHSGGWIRKGKDIVPVSARNGQDLHFHLIFWGFPRSAMAKEAIHWFCNVRHYGMFRLPKDSKGNSVGTTDYTWRNDLGWLDYLLSNLLESSDGVGRIRHFGTLKVRWNIDDWKAYLPKKGIWRRDDKSGVYEGDTEG